MKKLLEELFLTYYKDVYTYLYSLCRDASLSEDLASEVFLEVIKSISTFRGESDIKTWLFTIARRRWFTYLRKKKIQIPTLSIHELYDTAELGTQENTDTTILIQQLLSKEPETTQKVVMLRLQGYSYYEIAARCKISESSARVIFFRAKAKLKDNLIKEGLHYE